LRAQSASLAVRPVTNSWNMKRLDFREENYDENIAKFNDKRK